MNNLCEFCQLRRAYDETVKRPFLSETPAFDYDNPQ